MILVGTMALLAALLIPTFAWFLLADLFPFQPGLPRLIVYTLGFTLVVPAILSFPLSLVFSILRYRLWDIDIVINRALVYTLLTTT